MKLQKLSDYIYGVQNEPQHYDSADEHYKVVCDKLTRIYTYSEFLQTHLNIGMFVPAIFEKKQEPMCRDCADHNGTCPHTGRKCENENDKWKVLEEPKDYDNLIWHIDIGGGFDGTKRVVDECKQYQQAKDKVVFKNCVYDDEMGAVRIKVGQDVFNTHDKEHVTIEDLIEFGLELTEYGQSKLK